MGIPPTSAPGCTSRVLPCGKQYTGSCYLRYKTVCKCFSVKSHSYRTKDNSFFFFFFPYTEFVQNLLLLENKSLPGVHTERRPREDFTCITVIKCLWFLVGFWVVVFFFFFLFLIAGSFSCFRIVPINHLFKLTVYKRRTTTHPTFLIFFLVILEEHSLPQIFDFNYKAMSRENHIIDSTIQTSVFCTSFYVEELCRLTFKVRQQIFWQGLLL